jgi:DNA-binding transcriptional ArsR family regulator
MNLDLADAQRVLACLGDPSRFRMVAVLAGGDRCVTDIAREVRLSQSCTTRHLQVLLRHAIVSRVRQGKRVLFRLRDDEPDMASLLEWALLRSRHDLVLGARPQTLEQQIIPGEAAGEDLHRDRPSGARAGYEARDPISRPDPSPAASATAREPATDAATEPSWDSPRPTSDPLPVRDLEDYLL